MTRENEASEPVGLYDILVAWQEGWLPYRRALALTGMRTVTDLYEAAADSGVEIRMTMLPGEERAAARAIAAPLYEAARVSEIAGTDPYASEGLGDAAISWLVAKVPRLYGPAVTSLVLTEDASFDNTRLGRNVHVLSTRPFLATLQALGIIPSVAAVLKDIADAGRVEARYQTDRPALVGPKGTRRTQWTEVAATRSRRGIDQTSSR